ncbi:hypothetical protein [Cupriavidus gilardii]|uniref:Uncharacterized protein n=1 Tax=Cupriavidus gilardii TaxID=82541 RepID=A0A849BPH5_9BURK|nr:hypothetical protein [Cupriavidus gilardii]MCT9017171.1 hypothetical protein [Cupriavidus gilardii]MCT9056834.1 hypothetical protein [Cupriavidus gilardii]NNH14377.1 hypothetical protein [Cupriavidus gilardii]WNG67701.1 hypothetical protein QWJ31_07850 [Cupriavidus gilardii]
MIDIHDFRAMRERQAKNLRRLRAATWLAIGALLVANIIDIVRGWL